MRTAISQLTLELQIRGLGHGDGNLLVVHVARWSDSFGK